MENSTWQNTICTVLEYLLSNDASEIKDIEKIKVLEGIKPISNSILIDEKIDAAINTIRYYDADGLGEEMKNLISYVRDYD